MSVITHLLKTRFFGQPLSMVRGALGYVSDPLQHGVRVDADGCVWPRRNPVVPPRVWLGPVRQVGSNEAARVEGLQTLVNDEAAREFQELFWPIDLSTAEGRAKLAQVKRKFQKVLSGDNS